MLKLFDKKIFTSLHKTFYVYCLQSCLCLRTDLVKPKQTIMHVSGLQTLKILIAYPEQILFTFLACQPRYITLAQGPKNPLFLFLIITDRFSVFLSGILQTLLSHVTVCQTDWFMWVLKGHLVSQPGYLNIVKIMNGKFNVGPDIDHFVSVQI